MTVIAAVLLGALIGLSLGALGGGGSILTVPALVYALGESAHQATTSSLVIVGVTAAAAALGHARAGRVRWKAGAAFGGFGIAASLLGSYLNRLLEPNALLVAFAALMLIAAAAMLRQLRAASPSRTPVLVAVGGAAPEPVPARTSVGRPTTRAHTIAKMVTAGLAVGFLTGFLGVGGGFVIVPALTVALRYKMPIAVGTSLLVIAINSATALLARVGHETFHWAVIVPFAAAAVVASLAGKQVADRAAPDNLTRAFAAFMVLVAIYVGVRSGTALLS
jgi:uncharacterized membrane protein YfcA